MHRRRLKEARTNDDIARALRELSAFLEMEGVPFKPQAYEKAAHAIAALDQPLDEVHRAGGAKALRELPCVGKGIADRIAELFTSGHIADLDEFRAKVPIDVLGLMEVEGIGAKTARALYDALGVRDVGDLRRAAEEGKIEHLAHFGERSQAKILASLRLRDEASGRRPLGEVLPIARRIEQELRRVRGVEQVALAGSLRRHRETIGDIDIVVSATEPTRVAEAFAALPEVEAVLAEGPTKTMVRLSIGIDADLRVVPDESFGAALLYFTGSKAHNVALRTIARKRSLKLNEYGLFRGAHVVASRTEEEVYAALGLELVPPELREDAGEVEQARAHTLPTLISARDLRGDLQSHTTWTDGAASIEDMARAARALGLEYLAITDHTRDLAMTGGLDEAKLAAQRDEIRAAGRRVRGLRLLAGAEVNIRPDGTLDVADEALADLDIVGAAIHSHFDLPKDAMTRRILRALESPYVDVLFHPTSRQLGHRRPIEFDFEVVLAAALRTHTILEIDAQPQRMDLSDAMVRRAIEAGALLSLDSDAHSPAELDFVERYGVGVARRGWATPRHVANALPVEELRARLKRARVGRPRKRR